MINDLIKINPLDRELWMELALIYEKNLDYDYAIYCYEELILISQDDLNLYIKLSELLYSTGKLENLYLAKKYFCLVLLKLKSLRSMYGLKNTLKSIMEKNKKLEANDEELLKKIEKEILKNNNLII